MDDFAQNTKVKKKDLQHKECNTIQLNYSALLQY